MENDTNQKSAPVQMFAKFPLRRLYIFLVVLLTILSVLNISFQFIGNAWTIDGFSVNITVSSVTLVLLLLLWLPWLIPWFLPQLQDLLLSLRKSGIQEIGIGVIQIKLDPALEKAASEYQSKVLVSGASKESQEIERFYNQMQDLRPADLSAAEARQMIDQLCSNYDYVRAAMQPGSQRTREMTKIVSQMWALMPALQEFPVHERLKSPKDGERVSAYKYLEWKPNLDELDLLLSRAAGVLDSPFGQYGALLALRRAVMVCTLTSEQQDHIVQILNWTADIEYMKGTDRAFLIQDILKRMENSLS